MAIYTNLKAVEKQLHGLFESSNLMATDVGNLYDALVRDVDGKEISCDNGVALKIGEYTGNGLQERYATIAGLKDKIAVIGAPANVKTALTKEQSQPYNFTNPAGKPAKAYQIQDVDVHTDIFGIASYQFTDASAENVKVGALVTVDGKGYQTESAGIFAGLKYDESNDKIIEWLEENNIPFIPEYRFDDCRDIRSLPFDFKCNWNNKIILIEVDGGQHYYITQWNNKDDLISQKHRDNIKTKYCIDNGYTLLRIPFWDFERDTYKTKLNKTFFAQSDDLS